MVRIEIYLGVIAMSRPKEFDQTSIDKARKYLDMCIDQYEKRGMFEKLKVKVPTIEGLARYLKIHRDTVYQWEKENEEFSDILEELRSEQADRLLNMGLSGDYNSTIAKVLLTKHGYSDKQEIDQKTTVKDERINTKNLTDEQLRQLAEIQRASGISEA